MTREPIIRQRSEAGPRGGVMIRLRSLGECVIDLGGVRVGPESEVLFALLLYLIVERGHRVPRARLIELCWPGESDERARHNLRQALYKAKQLGATIGQDAGDVVMPAAEVWADYDELLDPAKQRGAPTLELETSEFLPSYQAGLSDALAEWLESRRAIVHSALRRHLVSRIAAARRSARWSDVERLARRCLELDEMNEEAVIGLAEATAVTGSRAKAAAILDKYLAELGPDAKLLGRPARELRRRIEQVQREGVDGQAVLLGREKEFASLVERLDRAFRGQGAVVQVSGPAGIGKSALVREFIALARIRGAALAPVYSHAAAQTQALGVLTGLVEVLLQLPGALGCSPEALDHCRLLTALQTPRVRSSDFDATLLRRRIEGSVVELAQAITEEAPLLVTVEDVHWADEASLERIRELAFALRECRALIILTGRTPLSRQEPWSNDIVSIELRGLERIAAEQLLGQWSGYPCSESAPYVEWCLQVADGHPLYLRELGDRWRIDGECYEMPPSLTSLLNTSLASLNRHCTLRP